jgi:CPA2 family monovalent cation:H+ antiporter-2
VADAHGILSELVPVILLLTLGVIAAVASRAVGLSPIVGYLILGLALIDLGLDLVADSTMIATLAELGVVFLLFDIGLHFSLGHIREQARDIFGFGRSRCWPARSRSASSACCSTCRRWAIFGAARSPR